jgi:aerobic-type carbon monoxide dehydrogenase small subunit (CoxS/CutS family)
MAAAPTIHVRLSVNGTDREVDAPRGTTMLAILRDDLGLTAARYGCGHGACGACYAVVDGRALATCKLTLEDAVGKAFTTVEGLAPSGRLHPVQQAFLDEDAMQCGYCTGGMLISATALLEAVPDPTESEIRAALAPHLCRCGVYGRAIRAVQRAASLRRR